MSTGLRRASAQTDDGWDSPAYGAALPSSVDTRRCSQPGDDWTGRKERREQAISDNPTKNCATLATYFAQTFRERCPRVLLGTTRVSHPPALAAQMASAVRDGVTLAEQRAAIDRFITLVGAGSIDVAGRPAWKVFLSRLPGLVGAVRNEPTRIERPSKRTYTRAEREAIVASYAEQG